MKPHIVFILIGGILAATAAAAVALRGGTDVSFLIPEWAQKRHEPARIAASVPLALDEEPNGRAIHIIRYGEKGFEPRSVSIPRGETVRFVNESGGTMRIVMEHWGTPPIRYVQAESGGRGSSFELSMHQMGVWRVSTLNGPASFTGEVDVR